MWIYDYESEKDNPYRELPFVRISHMCYIDNLPQWSYPYHNHEGAYEIAFIMSGTGNLVLESQTLPVAAGSITVIPPRMLHYFSTSCKEGMRYYALRILCTEEDGELQNFLRNLGAAVTPGINYLSHIQSTFQTLFTLHQVNGGIVDETFQSIALGLFHLTRSLFTMETLSVRLNDRFSASDILNYIAENSTTKFTLESLAKKFNVSPSHLSRIFCQAYHTSPINFNIYSRITYSTEYLLKTDLSIAEIARLVGYDNPTHFSNMFAKRIGCTPTEYRERNQKMPH